MTQPTREEQRRLVRQWEETGRELERIRKEALRGMPYRWEDVDALLELGVRSGCPQWLGRDAAHLHEGSSAPGRVELLLDRGHAGACPSRLNRRSPSYSRPFVSIRDSFFRPHLDPDSTLSVQLGGILFALLCWAGQIGAGLAN